MSAAMHWAQATAMVDLAAKQTALAVTHVPGQAEAKPYESLAQEDCSHEFAQDLPNL